MLLQQKIIPLTLPALLKSSRSSSKNSAKIGSFLSVIILSNLFVLFMLVQKASNLRLSINNLDQDIVQKILSSTKYSLSYLELCLQYENSSQ